MGMLEIFKNGGIKAIIENEEISSAIAETIRENKGKIVSGLFGLGALYIMKDRKIKCRMKDIEFEIE